MNFLVDECVGPSVADWLKSKGYSVISVFDGSIQIALQFYSPRTELKLL